MRHVSEVYKKLDSTKCYGCEACVQACHTGALNIKQDSEGFYIPSYNLEKCINCKNCIDVCQIGCEKDCKNHDVAFRQSAFAAYSNNEKILERSSSGGVFSELAVNVLEDNGVVIGAALLKNICKHIVITQLSELDKLRRSKYIQSRISDVYTVAKRYLEDEKQVMFCGCPCQVAGLKMFLGKDYKNLLAVDILCHGVPSPLLFDEHIRYLEELSGKRVNEYEFRLKENLQTPYYNCYVKYNEKETFKTCFEDVYFKLFLKEKTYRECCYKCEYASFDRVGDLSIGDYGWARNFHNELKDFDKSGLNISAILVNNEKGQNAIENLEEKVVLIESDINYLATRNKAINAPAKRPDIRDKIYKEINIQGYSAWADKYKKSKEYTEYRKIKLKYFLKRIMSN